MLTDWIPLSECLRLPAVAGVYVIRNTIDGKEYVGKSVNVRKRVSAHKRGVSHALYLGRAIAQHGASLFQVCVLRAEVVERLSEMEISVIAERRCLVPAGYNLSTGGEGSTGWKPNEEQKAKATAAASKPKSAKMRAAISEVNRNRSAEHWAKVAAKTREREVTAATREKHSFNAKNRSESHRAAIAKANSGKFASPETKAKMSERRSKPVLVWVPEAMTPLEFPSAQAAGAWAGKSGTHVSLYISGRLKPKSRAVFAYA